MHSLLPLDVRPAQYYQVDARNIHQEIGYPQRIGDDC